MLEKSAKSGKPVLAQNIIRLRKLRNWTAAELAERADVSYPTLRDIEAGYSNGRETTRQALADALEVTMSELYANAVEQADLASETHDKDALIGQLVALLPALNESQLGGLLETAKAAASKNPAAKRNAR